MYRKTCVLESKGFYVSGSLSPPGYMKRIFTFKKDSLFQKNSFFDHQDAVQGTRKKYFVMYTCSGKGKLMNPIVFLTFCYPPGPRNPGMELNAY